MANLFGKQNKTLNGLIVKNEFVDFILAEEYDSVLDCLDKTLDTPVFEGKIFWEAEKDMEWIDWQLI